MDESQQHQPSVQTGGSDPDEELARLRERLAFYESFDQLIQDNVSRAGNLLREAATRHQDSELAIRTSSAQFEHRQLAERTEYRKIFSALLDDVTTVQQNVERLAHQIADALDDLEAVIPAAGEAAALESDALLSIPTFRPTRAGEIGAGAPHSDETAPEVAASDSVGEPLESAAEESGAGSGEGRTYDEYASEFVADIDLEYGAGGSGGLDQIVGERFAPRVESSQAEPVDELLPEDDSGGELRNGGLQPSTGVPGSSAFSTFSGIVQASVERVSQAIGGRGGPEPSASDETHHEDHLAEPEGFAVDLAPTSDESDDDADIGLWAETGEPAATTLLVHGVPRATIALSLKRYLEGLDQVHSVEPREFAEGVLRLQVSSERPMRLDDLQGWPEASALEPMDIRDDFVEVRLG